MDFAAIRRITGHVIWTRLRALSISERLFGRIIASCVVIGFLSVIVAGGVAGWTVFKNQETVQWVSHTYQVEQQISLFRVALERRETAHRGYLLDQDFNFRNTYRLMNAELPRRLSEIEQLVADNSVQRQHMRTLEPLLVQLNDILDARMTAIDSGDVEGARATFKQDPGVPILRRVRQIIEMMVAEENRLLAIRTHEQKATERYFFTILAVTGALVVLIGMVSLWAILRYTRDLADSRDALRKLNNNLEGVVSERTVDLQRANAEIQRFAYIVSHDLRSPLVNVMGFTSELESAAKRLGKMIDTAEEQAPEVVSEDARQAAREDLPEAIGFIRTSTQKMDRLINAILKLSREGRRTITSERLDLGYLVQSIIDSVRHRIDEIGADVAIEGDLPSIQSDRLAVEQILSNLIENALKYSAPDRPLRIRIRGRKEGAMAIFEVQDNGRGIDPRDHERVFDLFRRSGVQDQPGEGIGLAHVRATAYRLGGTISSDSALDQGATFRLSLPVIFTSAKGGYE
jgi:signal transduction histidine kinase